MESAGRLVRGADVQGARLPSLHSFVLSGLSEQAPTLRCLSVQHRARGAGVQGVVPQAESQPSRRSQVQSRAENSDSGQSSVRPHTQQLAQ